MKDRRCILPGVKAPFIALLAALALFSACATKIVVAPADMPPTPLSTSVVALTQPGPSAVTIHSASMRGVYGCPVAYEIYAPDAPVTDVTIFLAHGFQRDLTHMRGWANLWASYGVRTVIMSLCNSTWTAGNHDRNAQDMRALADALGNGPVIYAGFSAGGLAALLAAAADPRAIAYLGLDAVDSGDLAAPAARALKVPALFLLGMPTACNANGNMATAIPAIREATAARVRATVHCMFEDPSDSACASLCGTVEPAEAARQSALVIHALATAWVLDKAIGSEAARTVLADVWAGGTQWQGRVDVLRAP
jgi:pimeloyl-ACP methyl ester carboxylesterase